MRVPMRAAGILGSAVALVVGGLAATAPAATTPIEINYQNPVTALPPVSRPDVTHCTTTVMQHDFANSYGQPFTATLAPPAACPGPWSKVVLDWNGNVAGRQFDRLAGVWIGGSEVFRTSTPEPDPAGISWHVDQDISSFTPLLRTPQPVVVDLGNIVDSTYTGIYHMTMTITYYQADRAHPEAAHPDVVVPISQPTTTSAGWWALTKGQTATATVSLPRNVTGAHLQLYARGGGCEEFWYSNVPDSYAAAHPDYGLCAGGSYREVAVAIDGKPAGMAQPFPVIYTGGVSPLMWRPIPSVDAFRTQPYDVDLTPFAGLLSDGRQHQVTLSPPDDITDVWLMDGSLFLTTDRGSAQTSGVVTADTITPTAVTTTQSSPSTGTDVIKATASNDWTVAGYVDTSHGRVYSQVTQHLDYANSDTISGSGTKQVISQRDSGWNLSSSHGGRHDGATKNSWSYPIDMTSTFIPGSTSDSFTVSGQVNVARELSTLVRHGDDWQSAAFTDDRVKAAGVLQRTNGNVTEADGSDSEHYVGFGPETNWRWYDHYIAADHGYVTQDIQRAE